MLWRVDGWQVPGEWVCKFGCTPTDVGSGWTHDTDCPFWEWVAAKRAKIRRAILEGNGECTEEVSDA